MRFFKRFIVATIMVAGVLAVIAQFPMMVLAGLFLGILPGAVLIAAPTILLYSLSLLPAVFLLADLPFRWTHICIALLLPATVALGPGAVARYEVWLFAKNVSQNDFQNVISGKPKTIEIIADELTDIFTNGDGDTRVPCGEACRRVLFNQEAEQVRLTKSSASFRKSRNNRSAFSVSYHIEQRPSCPDLSSPNGVVDKAIRDRLAAGQCLIFEVGDNEPRDATLDFTTLNHWQLNSIGNNTPAPVSATIERVVRLQITRQQPGGTSESVEQRTEVKALVPSIPFYIGYELHMQGGGYNGPVFGRVGVVENSVDSVAVLRRTFGFATADIAPLSAADATKLVDYIFSLPHDTSPTLSRGQQSLLADIVVSIANKPDLVAADFDFVVRLLNEPRIGEATIGFNIQKIMQRNLGKFSSTIPAMLDRIETPALQSDGRYQTALAFTVMTYPADTLRPYRDRIMRILETEKWGPAAPLLTRIGELGEFPIDLITERLKSKAPEVRGAAALAICRADKAVWPAIEPITLSHLAESAPDSSLKDDHRKLILALVRFGNKAAASEALTRLLSRFQEEKQKRLTTFEPNFAADRCKDYL